MNILAVIHVRICFFFFILFFSIDFDLQCYITIKAMTPVEHKKVVPHTVLFAGKAAPGYYAAKLTIHLIINVAHVINADPELKGLLTILFLPEYSVYMAELNTCI